MKKWLRASYAMFFLVPAFAMAGSSILQVSPDVLGEQTHFQTDLDMVNGRQIRPTKNTSMLNARQQLRDFILNITSAKGKFVQTTTGGKVKQPQLGTFAFKRPGKFVWNINTPFEQRIISDGDRVYQYDPDLMQVTERLAQQAVGASPAAILFGEGALDENFILDDLPARDDRVWLRATPKIPDAGMRYIDIAFANNLPVELQILDSFGQTTVITLNDVNVHADIPSALFHFIAPEGVDRVRLN